MNIILVAISSVFSFFWTSSFCLIHFFLYSSSFLTIFSSFPLLFSLSFPPCFLFIFSLSLLFLILLFFSHLLFLSFLIIFFLLFFSFYFPLSGPPFMPSMNSNNAATTRRTAANNYNHQKVSPSFSLELNSNGDLLPPYSSGMTVHKIVFDSYVFL